MVRLSRLQSVSVIASIVVVLDQLTKAAITSLISAGQKMTVIGNIFDLSYIQNTGAGFGILKGYNIFLILASLSALGALAYFWNEIPKKGWQKFFVGLIAGGLLGNLLDRIFLGYVVDMFDFKIWPVFNIADSAITVGVVGLILYELLKKKK